MSRSRHADYKSSGVEWFGDAPSHWVPVPLFAAYDERFKKNDGGKVQDVLSLSHGRIIPRDVDSNHGLLPASFDTYQIVEAGDIILRLTDLQNDQRSLRVGQSDQRGIITSAYSCLTPKLNIDRRFGFYLLNGYDLMKVFYSQGGGVRQSMDYKDLKRLPLFLPALQEQKAIVRFLDRETARIDTLITKQERLIELLQEKRQALITRAVTKGLDPDAPMKDSGVAWLGEVPAHWEVAKLKHIATVRGGVAKGRNLGDSPTVRLPYLRVANVQDGYIDLTEVAEIEVAVTEVERYSLRKGDVLMNEGGDNDKLGRGDVWNGEIHPCLHQNHVFAVRPMRVVSEWLALLTSAGYAKRFFESRAKQTTNLASISSTNLSELPVVLPPQHEQRELLSRVAASLAELDTLSAKTQSMVELAKEHRSSLISAAVTGKIDVREVFHSVTTTVDVREVA